MSSHPSLPQTTINFSSPRRGPRLLLRDHVSWSDWTWQQRNSTTSVAQLGEVFPGLDANELERIATNLRQRKLTLTPHVLSLIQTVPGALRPVEGDPIWKQLVPTWLPQTASAVDYNGHTDNWEMPEEMKTPICQHKYPNRVILRVANVCHSYCQFCYEALRTLETSSEKGSLNDTFWSETVDYVRANEGVEEVILSGGEPLMLSDRKLDAMLGSLRAIPRPLALRIHTRSLTFNPYRITASLLQILTKHAVQAVGLHVSCVNEIGPDFVSAVEALGKVVPILFANIPLLRGVNDSVEQMHALCMLLYRHGVVPHYLYHFMPFSPGGAAYRTTVRQGIEIVRALKRKVSNIAVPEFVLPHASGKFSPPLMAEGETMMEWSHHSAGLPVVRYTNWRGDRVEYADARDA